MASYASSSLFLLFCYLHGSCFGSGTFGFNLHYAFSDSVRPILAARALPVKGSLEYYGVLAHRDSAFRLRHLSDSDEALTFLNGNQTYLLPLLGFLHYANISIGSPSKSFLVALDTGSDLLWLPCDCISCVYGLKTPSGFELDLNVYSPNTSSTSMNIPCNSNMCLQHCSATNNACPYQVVYLSNNTSSTGTLVEDVLQLVAENGQSRAIGARITFGCGRIQTGTFLNGAAPNGLFGLGMKNISVPSILAHQGLAANSFSMCFSYDGIGRITFGDEGSSDQGETPFIFHALHPSYNISITQIDVGKISTNISFTAIFDTGTSFTYVNEPIYTQISESFASQAQGKRYITKNLPFEYCYDANQNEFSTPNVTLTMKGGNHFRVTHPIELVSNQDSIIYCLGVVKSGDVNIIGQNFMIGYRINFDREKMVLGWKESNCYDTDTNASPVEPSDSSVVPPALDSSNPEAASENQNNSQMSTSPSLKNVSDRLNSFCNVLIVMSFLPFLRLV